MTRSEHDFSDIGTGHVPDHFRSPAEMISAMASHQYRNDSAYRAEVAQKITASGVLGIPLVDAQLT